MKYLLEEYTHVDQLLDELTPAQALELAANLFDEREEHSFGDVVGVAEDHNIMKRINARKGQ